jgi:predicted MFS family arabinose efflux permease
VKQLLRRKGFRSLLIGQGISALGDWMGTIALMVLVSQQSGSSTAVGGILVLRLIPAAVGGPIAARLAQRWDRRRTMLTMDLLRAGIVAVVPLVSALWWAYLWAFMLELASLAFLPARDSSIPDLAGDDLPVANGLVLGSSYGTIPLGAAAFALAAALTRVDIGIPAAWSANFALAFWIDAATFLVSFAFLRGIVDLRGAARAEHVPVDGGLGSPRTFTEALRIPLIRAVIPATLTAALGVGALFSLGIVFVRDLLGATDAEFGAMIALFGVGAAGGLGLLSRRREADLLATVRTGVAAQGVVIVVFSLAPTLAGAFIGAVGFGAAASFTLAAGMSALQSRLQDDERVLAFTVFHVVIRAGLSLAALGAGIAADLVAGVNWPLVGHLEPERLVLFCAGALVFASAGFVRESMPEQTEPKEAWRVRLHRH